MEIVKDFNIPFAGLKQGKHTFTYRIDNKFFDAFQYDDYNTIDCKAFVLLDKKPSFFELNVQIEGLVNLNCDLTNEAFNQEIDNTLDLVVKFGEEYNDDLDDILILPHSEYQLNVSQYIYEALVLALPVKRIHPGIEDGSLQSEVLDKLEELQQKQQKRTDPRWDKLNDLLT